MPGLTFNTVAERSEESPLYSVETLRLLPQFQSDIGGNVVLQHFSTLMGNTKLTKGKREVSPYKDGI